MVKPVDNTGRRFGRLIAIRRTGSNAYGQARWFCQCDCGRTHTVPNNDLRSGNTVSCGCTPSNYRHGHAKNGKTHPLYWVWNSMRDRCNNPNDPAYKNYGGRGIKVCKRWTHNFAAFLSDVGERPHPKLTIDRINNNGNYTPKNVKWSTRKEQLANRRIKPSRVL